MKKMIWIDAKKLGVAARPFKDALNYRRLTEEDNEIMTKVNENGFFPKLGRNSAGMHVDFKTDSRELFVRWSVCFGDPVTNFNLIGYSGLDCYMFYEGAYRYLGSGIPTPKRKTGHEACIMPKHYKKIPKGMNLFSLNLCNYDECKKIEIGIDDDAKIEGVPFKSDYIAVYGSSITQGGCSSRPGMAYTHIMRRTLNEEVYNMGFSGAGLLEPEMTEILNKLDPKLMILDCVANMCFLEDKFFIERYNYFYDVFRKSHPKTPVLVIEQPYFTNSWAWLDEFELKNYVLRDVVSKWKDKNVFYLKGDDLYGHDFEASTDGVHPTDLGFLRMSQEIVPYVKEILKK